MAQNIEGTHDARGLRVAIIVTRWNDFIVKRLLDGALECIGVHGGDPSRTVVVTCPGAFEIPIVARRLISTGKFDVIVALGTVVRGETAHFEYVAGAAAEGIAAAMADSGVPIGFGVLTVENVDQAIERSGVRGENKGWEATLAAVETFRLLRSVDDV